MPLLHAVLAFLEEGPSYGYELKTHFESTVGPQWGGLNIGHVYQILDRLKRNEMITVSSRVVQANRPDRTLYAITPAGSAELADWLRKPATRGFHHRDEFVVKVLAAMRFGPDAVRELCRVQRASLVSELAALRLLRETPGEGPLALLAIEAAILHTQADLKVVSTAEERADWPLGVLKPEPEPE
jgi:DNA-binding PadR family transcriptional regulator